MTIQTFEATEEGQAAALAVPDPKNIVFDGSVFIVAYGEDYAPPFILVPNIITPSQARLALLQVGKLDAVEAAMVNAPRAMRIKWEFATEVHRGDPDLISFTESLGLTGSELNDLFILASGL
jgi:hypothetical protein